MEDGARKRRLVWTFVAATFLAAVSLACGMANGTAIPACQDSATGDLCSTCCSQNGYSGHLYNSFDQPPCECM